MQILRLEAGQFAEFGPRIAELEHGVSYPLGADRFEIRHGDDYFAFFRRLGDLAYFVACEGERIVGVLAAVLRDLPTRTGRTRVWYLCDLKAFASSGRSVAAGLIGAFDEYATRCGVRDSYAISMNPPAGPNRLLRVAERWLGQRPRIAGILRLYSCDAATMRHVAPSLESAGRSVRYLSLRGVKEIVLASTGLPMPLLHVQHGPLAAGGIDVPDAGATHMFCLLESDVRNFEMHRFGLAPSATATLFVRSPIDVDFRCVLTSDI